MTEQASPEPATVDSPGHELALSQPAPVQMVPQLQPEAQSQFQGHGQLLPQPPGILAVGTMMKRRNVFAVWLGLPLVTLGIYNLVWWYKVNAEMAAFDRRHPVNPAATLLAFLFGWILVVPPYLAVYGTGQRIAERQRAAGLAPTCSPALGIVLVFVLGLHTLYYQSELNKIVDHYGAPAGAQVSLAA